MSAYARSALLLVTPSRRLKHAKTPRKFSNVDERGKVKGSGERENRNLKAGQQLNCSKVFQSAPFLPPVEETDDKGRLPLRSTSFRQATDSDHRLSSTSQRHLGILSQASNHIDVDNSYSNSLSQLTMSQLGSLHDSSSGHTNSQPTSTQLRKRLQQPSQNYLPPSRRESDCSQRWNVPGANDNHKQTRALSSYTTLQCSDDDDISESILSQPLLTQDSAATQNIVLYNKPQVTPNQTAYTPARSNPKKRSWMSACMDVLSTPYRSGRFLQRQRVETLKSEDDNHKSPSTVNVEKQCKYDKHMSHAYRGIIGEKNSKADLVEFDQNLERLKTTLEDTRNDKHAIESNTEDLKKLIPSFVKQAENLKVKQDELETQIKNKHDDYLKRIQAQFNELADLAKVKHDDHEAKIMAQILKLEQQIELFSSRTGQIFTRLKADATIVNLKAESIKGVCKNEIENVKNICCKEQKDLSEAVIMHRRDEDKIMIKQETKLLALFSNQHSSLTLAAARLREELQAIHHSSAENLGADVINEIKCDVEFPLVELETKDMLAAQKTNVSTKPKIYRNTNECLSVQCSTAPKRMQLQKDLDLSIVGSSISSVSPLKDAKEYTFHPLKTHVAIKTSHTTTKRNKEAESTSSVDDKVKASNLKATLASQISKDFLQDDLLLKEELPLDTVVIPDTLLDKLSMPLFEISDNTTPSTKNQLVKKATIAKEMVCYKTKPKIKYRGKVPIPAAKSPRRSKRLKQVNLAKAKTLNGNSLKPQPTHTQCLSYHPSYVAPIETTETLSAAASVDAKHSFSDITPINQTTNVNNAINRFLYNRSAEYNEAHLLSQSSNKKSPTITNPVPHKNLVAPGSFAFSRRRKGRPRQRRVTKGTGVVGTFDEDSEFRFCSPKRGLKQFNAQPFRISENLAGFEKNASTKLKSAISLNYATTITPISDSDRTEKSRKSSPKHNNRTFRTIFEAPSVKKN